MPKNKYEIESYILGNNTEQVLWTGKPSQMVNISLYFFSLLLIISTYFLYKEKEEIRILYLIILPSLFCLVAFLRTFCTLFILSDERIIKRYGIFNKYIFDIELYRVKDVLLVEPFLYRFFNLGNIRLLTSQKSLEKFFLPGIKYPNKIRNELRNLVEQRRLKRGVKEFDTN